MTLPPNTIIACGPVIIEDGKVLLDKEEKDFGITPWFFPGGKMEDFNGTFEDVCIREAKEELNIDVEILRPLRPLMMKRVEDDTRYTILIHFLAKRTGEISIGDDVVEWGWFDIHNLPEDCAPNVKIVIDDYLKSLSNI